LYLLSKFIKTIYLARVVGVEQQRLDRDVDRLDARVYKGGILFVFGIVEKRFVISIKVKHGLIARKIIGNILLRLLVLELDRARVVQGGGKALDVLCERWSVLWQYYKKFFA
jgi:hypothetical protein